MNIPKVINSQKLYDLYEQIFDYFSLTVYDLESKIDTNLNISNIKNKLETFSDKHFKNALNDFNQEVKKLKSHIPDDFLKIEQINIYHAEYFALSKHSSFCFLVIGRYSTANIHFPISNISFL